MTVPVFTKYPSSKYPLTFATDMDTMISEFPAFIAAENALAANVDAKEAICVTQADIAVAQGVLAVQVANFKGEWSGLSGAAAVPYTVYHSGDYWALLSNLANVAAKEPGVDPEWAVIAAVSETRLKKLGRL